MRALWLALSCMVLAALGCRTNPNQVLLERDLRLQEDKIYHLKALVEDAEMSREATLRENEELKRELGSGERGYAPSRPAPRGDLRAPAVELPGGERTTPSRSRPEAPKLEAPVIELPGLDETPAPSAVPGADVQSNFTTGDAIASQLVINKRLTGGLDRDGRAGDEGVFVAMELRDTGGNLVQAPGSVSIVLMDPKLEGDASRVARWNITSDELPKYYRETALARGFQFELPWPGDPPLNRDLQLFVRYNGITGEKLTADTRIDVRAPLHHPRHDWQSTNSRPASVSRTGSRDSSSPRSSGSRLKSRNTQSDVRQTSAEGEIADDSGEAEGEASQERYETARSDRPVWKPYR